ncbi:MAG: ligase-associated DNA damage response exonuclease [Bacteroidota bacterium]|nr:ligase-associated DNA damage response exonuclease [Bacteroidota bacterium]MDX5447326.1 ligase-associated DNA damage response exonuclease [Bacteroidota bacterium]MDX5506605.1 ligase-associated DNA damage response exonuclease [Bacteroidota bacterium]
MSIRNHGSLLEVNEMGIYCPRADVYIDPWKPVKRALITHGHADHARPGSRYYLSTATTLSIMKHRLGDIHGDPISFGEVRTINGVRFSFHPAGHVPGSAQIRVEFGGEVWVVTGDYKRENDGLTEAFEVVKCHTLVTESTFGLPVFSWSPQSRVISEIEEWWRDCAQNGVTPVLGAYSLGKAQRIIASLDPALGHVWTHGAIENMNEVLREVGYHVPVTRPILAETNRDDIRGQLVVCPPAALGSNWMRSLGHVSTGIASGWMRIRGARRRRAADRGFVLSDHADWSGLNETIEDSGAERVFVTHGYRDLFSKWIREEIGIEAHPLETYFEDISEDEE